MNATGFEQVKLAAQAIRLQDWDVVLTSPLIRARQTADILLDAVGFSEVVEEGLLIERSFGEAEGLSYEQWRAKYANLDDIPGGESRSELASRAQQLLDLVAGKYSGKRVLAVSHGALIRNLLAIASKNELPRDGERLGNASLNTFVHHASDWRVIDYQLDPLQP